MDAPIALPLDLVRPVVAKAATTTAAAASAVSGAPTEAAKRAAIGKTAQAFEAQFLSSMFSQMFDGVETAPPFGGGEGEDAFRSFFSDALGKEVARRGGIGLAKSVEREMLKLQGLS